MQAFLIRLIEISREESIKLSQWAQPRCNDYKIIQEPYRTFFVGALRSPVDTRKFVKTMRANMKNWGIAHVPNQRWIDDITMEEFIENWDGFYNERMAAEKHAKDVIDALILRELEEKATNKMKSRRYSMFVSNK